MSTEKYQPSNGTDGDIFRARFCDQCAHENLGDDADEDPCEILGRTFAYSIDHKNYPSEWTYDENGEPTCTRFLHDSETPNHRCTKTKDFLSE